MKYSKQKGFSLIELLIVVVIIGIIAAIAIPYLVKAVGKAENTKGYAGLKVVSKAQIIFYSRNNRFARLDELASDAGEAIGTYDGASSIKQGVFTLTMNPATDEELKDNFEIIATKSPTQSNLPCVISVDASNIVTEVFANDCITPE